jgi:hypothetical protein
MYDLSMTHKIFRHGLIGIFAYLRAKKPQITAMEQAGKTVHPRLAARLWVHSLL